MDVLSRRLFSVVEDRNDRGYGNFKDAVAERQGSTRHDAYLEVWRCMAKNSRDEM